MRLLHVISSLDPAGGGPPLVATRLAAAQAALGADVHVLAYRSPEADARVQDSFLGLPGVERLHFHYLPPPGRLERVTAWGARRSAREYHADIDWVHLHGVWDPILRQAAAVARQLGKPYAVVPHGMLDPWSLAQQWTKKRLALALGYRSMLNHASFIHALNADEGGLTAKLGLTCPAVVIPNGIFPEEFQDPPISGSFHRDRPELEGRRYVLFLSRLHPGKGLDLLVDAFALIAPHVPDVQLVVVGPDYGSRADLQARVAAAKVLGRVHVVGGLFGRDKLAAMADAACFCLPSRHEGFSIAILEALACGVPVVISDACHFPEVAEAGAGRVVPLDAGAIAAAMREVLASPETRRRMGQAGRELVRSRFTWPAVARLSLEAYQRASRAAPPGA